MESRATKGKICARCILAATIVLALTGLSSLLARADVPEPAPSKTELAPNDSATKPDYEAATKPDQIGRIVVPVMVNDRGPFLFVLDTGATRTVLTPELVAALGLRTVDDGGVTMNGATGSAVVPTTEVERVSVGDVVLEKQELPVAGALTSGIDGILGADALENKRIMVDFATGKIEVRDARHQRPLQGAERLATLLTFGPLMVVDAYVDRIRVKAVIDTGSESTLGNIALRTALRAPAYAKAKNAAIDVLGETLALQRGESQTVTTLRVGDIRADHFSIVFGQFYIFKLWDLESQPALLIGMDLIGKLNALVIDYGRREVQLRAAQITPGRLTRQ